MEARKKKFKLASANFYGEALLALVLPYWGLAAGIIKQRKLI